MDIIIDKLEGFTVVGVTKRVSMFEQQHLKQIPAFWDEVMSNQAFMAACDEDETLFGVLHNFDMSTMDYDYTIALRASDIAGIDDVTVVEIPAIDYAIFDKEGPLPESVQSLWRFIMDDWLPNSKFERADGPDVEVYPAGDPNSDDYKCHVWIPVVSK